MNEKYISQKLKGKLYRVIRSYFVHEEHIINIWWKYDMEDYHNVNKKERDKMKVNKYIDYCTNKTTFVALEHARIPNEQKITTLPYTYGLKYYSNNVAYIKWAKMMKNYEKRIQDIICGHRGIRRCEYLIVNHNKSIDKLKMKLNSVSNNKIRNRIKRFERKIRENKDRLEECNKELQAVIIEAINKHNIPDNIPDIAKMSDLRYSITASIVYSVFGNTVTNNDILDDMINYMSICLE